MADRPIIKIIPGSTDDPDRVRCFDAVQLALAGSAMGSAMAALIDSLACSVAVGATDRQHAAHIIAGIARDLATGVDDNWDQVKAQLPTNGAPTSEMAH